MEASVLRETGQASPALFKDARAGFLRLQSDERLVALTRRGNETAFETLISRYRARLLAFCRHMVGSTEDAEDILQEVFVAAYRAMLADERELNVRPWLYRIARNRSLNHLRRPRPTGVDSMDIYEGGASASTADRVQGRLDLEDLVEDVKNLPETQRTALMLREMGQLSYDQIADAMETSIPSVKSLLVRARVSLAEAAESRRLSCDEVRLELGAVAEGLQKLSSPVRRHVADCDRCRAFKKELAVTNRKLAVLAPVGFFVLAKNVAVLKLFGGIAGLGGSSAGAGVGAATGAGSGAAAAAGGAVVAGGAAGGGVSAGAAAGFGAIAVKAAATVAAAAVVTAGATQVAKHDIANRAADKPQIAAPAEPRDVFEGVTDSTGGTPVDESAVAQAEEQAGPTGETGATGVTDTETDPTGATGEPTAAVPPSSHTPAPREEEIIDEETTTVVIEPTHDDGPTGPSAPSKGERPGLPTAPPSGATGPPPTGGGSTGGGSTGSTQSVSTATELAPPSAPSEPTPATAAG